MRHNAGYDTQDLVPPGIRVCSASHCCAWASLRHAGRWLAMKSAQASPHVRTATDASRSASLDRSIPHC